jgi:hypothetical protein
VCGSDVFLEVRHTGDAGHSPSQQAIRCFVRHTLDHDVDAVPAIRALGTGAGSTPPRGLPRRESVSNLRR